MAQSPRRRAAVRFTVIIIGLALWGIWWADMIFVRCTGLAGSGDILERQPLLFAAIICNAMFWPWAAAYLAAIYRRDCSAWWFISLILMSISPLVLLLLLRKPKPARLPPVSRITKYWKRLFFLPALSAAFPGAVHPLLFVVTLPVFAFVWWRILKMYQTPGENMPNTH